MADQTKVRVGLKGFAYIADVGTAEPAKITDDPGEDWDPDDWTDLGLITEDGLAENLEQERKDFFSWGNLEAPVRVLTTKVSFSFQMTFEEESVPVLSLYFSTPVAGFTDVPAVASGDIAPQQLKFNSSAVGNTDVRALGIDILDGVHVNRLIIPRCEVAERGNIVHKGDELKTYQMTFRPLLDFASGSAVSVKRTISNLALPA
jgi:hypothetical protein